VRLFYQETLFIGDTVRYIKKALETGISLHRGDAGKPRGGGYLPGNSRDGRRRGLETEHLSQWELCERNLEGGLL